MTPHSELVAELLLVAQSAEADASALRAIHERGAPLPFGTLEDHRVEVIGEMLAAIDRAHPGPGTRLQAAMHPTTSDEESAS